MVGVTLILESTDLDSKHTPLDLQTLIILSKVKGPTISTDFRRDCGGYGSRPYKYKIDLEAMQPVPWHTAIPGAQPRKMLWPELWLNEPVLSTATLIATKSMRDTPELTFYTAIPAEFITTVKAPDERRHTGVRSGGVMTEPP